MIKKSRLYRAFYNYRWRERLIHNGNRYPDKTFYVIRRHASSAGLFSFISTNLGSIRYALEKGYTPVIDMMSSPSPMLTKDEVGKVNAWELFFKQPCGYGLDDIKDAGNVVLSSIETPDSFPDFRTLSNADEIALWTDLMHKYVTLTPEIEKECDKYIAEHFSGKKVLGILCRGTDYLMSKPSGHPVQPEPEQVITDAKHLLEKYGIDLIYLATEDLNIWEAFNKAFPGIVISFQKSHFTTSASENINEIANKTHSPFERNKEYLSSIHILSRCNYFLAGATSGSIGALLMSPGFEYQKLYMLGTYN